MYFSKAISAAAVVSTLAACGGGGGGTTDAAAPAPAPAPITYGLSTPTALATAPAFGRTSFTTPVSDYGYGIVEFPAESFNDSVSAGVTANSPAVTTGSFPMYPAVHLTDTKSALSWQDGWTGKDVNITVIDDFTTASISVQPFFSVDVSRTKISQYFRERVSDGTYDVNYSINYTIPHGELVAGIAGGNSSGQLVGGSFVLKYNNSSLRSCNATPTACTTKFYNSQLYYPKSVETYTHKLVAGVAKEALVTKNNVNLAPSQNSSQTVAYLQGHLKNSILSSVVNLSLGYNIPTTGQTFDQVMSAVATSPLPSKLNSVIVVAAGNGGAPCATVDLAGCNALAVAMAYQDATKDSTIVAGALTGTGSSENIASYSTRAGVLASRFLLASGETGFSGVAGTSFAAPRIAGAAAIIKQKYPSLSAKQIADVLLLSANKDINNSGTPLFSGVHPVYGQGKLDLQRALNLAGAI